MPHRADTDDEILEALLPLCGEVREPAPTTGAGSGAHGDPKLVAPEEVVQRLDEIFARTSCETCGRTSRVRGGAPCGRTIGSSHRRRTTPRPATR